MLLAYAVVQVDSVLLNVLVQQQAETKEQLRVHTRYLQEIVNRQKGLDDVRAGRLPDCIKLPVKSYNEIVQLEQSVIADSNRRKLVSKFIKCCQCYVSIIALPIVFINQLINHFFQHFNSRKFIHILQV